MSVTKRIDEMGLMVVPSGCPTERKRSRKDDMLLLAAILEPCPPMLKGYANELRGRAVQASKVNV
jgi:hypothetical protein